jgi:hypothetical protein
MSRPVAEPVDWKKYREAIDIYCKVYPEDNLSLGHLALRALVGEMAERMGDACLHASECPRANDGRMQCDCGLDALVARAKEVR